MSDVQLVVFDLGGVLVRIVSGWDEAHAVAGLGARPVPSSETYHRERMRLSMAHQVGQIDSALYFAEIARVSEGGYTAAEVERLILAWQSDEYDGVEGVIDALHAAGVETAALSNTNATHWAELRPQNGEARFPAVAKLQHGFASHIVQAAKPEAAMYEAVERATGAAPGRILFFDDVAANVDAARVRGWSAETIDPAGDTAAQLREHLVRYGVIGTS